MQMRGLPGMLAPMYQESVPAAASVTRFECMGHPVVLGFERRLDDVEAVAAHVGDRVGDEVDVVFDSERHVVEHRRALRAGDDEQVREVVDREPR